MTPVEKLLARRVITPEGCWELAGQRHRRYGQLRGQIYAHRLAFETWVGPIPAGMLVCRRCDNPPCFNPAHLFAGTKSDNLRDAEVKGIWAAPTRLERCQRGHLMTEANVYVRRDRPGHRECKACRLLASKRYRTVARDELDRDASTRLAEAIG